VSDKVHRGYTGRFAPSPTGPLHFGSLLAAVASYLDARQAGGRWLLRIENIDPPREQAGAVEAILRTLDVYGFEWDGGVIYQRDSEPRHREAVDRLLANSLAYPCSCSRSDLADAGQGPLGSVYPGTCRRGCSGGETAIRVLTHSRPIRIVDRLQGPYEQRLETDSGDFVIRRRDGLIAYQLAVAVDDAVEGISHVVRGIDLLDSTPRQIHLQQLLDLPQPSYAHIPVVVNDDGSKLSKNTGARPLSDTRPVPTLVRALASLGQRPEAGLEKASLRDVWHWAIAHWSIEPLRGQRHIALQHYC